MGWSEFTDQPFVYLDKTIQYVYNGIGNIESVTTTYSSGTPSTKNFTYGDSAHPDRLTKFGNYAITYNTMGCPTSYNGKNFTWNKGKLTQVSQSSTSSGTHRYTYTYNAKGQRVQKVYTFLPGQQALTDYITRATTTYTYDNAGRLIREYYTETLKSFSTSNREFIYLYDESGMVGVRFKENNDDAQVFYYQKNLQGDVVAIYNTLGAVQAKYSYDAFGNCSITNSTNTHLANYNPIRYRGYYFDDETGWYFLNARYYSPEWRRFISPDDTAYLDPESVNGLNLYCYCNNDPVNYADPSGYSPKWLQGLATGLAIAGAILVAGAVTVLTCGVGALAGTMLGAVIYGAAQGIAIGATIGVLGGGIVGGVVSDWSTEGILIGIGLGLGVGAIVGGIIGGFAGASSFTANSVYISQYGGDTKQVLSAYKGNPKLKVLNKDTTAFRTWGGESGKFGHWISPKNYGSAARSKLSLPPWNTAENTSQFLISKGSVVLSGRAAPLFGQAGGGIQWWIGLL